MGKLDHRVPFPKAGKGFFLFFSMQSIAEIEEIYGEDYFGDVERLVNMASAKCVMACLTAALRTPDGELAQIDFGQKLDFSFDDAAPAIMDALSFAVSGKSYKELVAEMEKIRKRHEADAAAALKEAAAKGDDPFAASGGSSATKPTASSRA